MIPFTINVYERGAGGAPTTSAIDNLARSADSLEWTIADQFGFESLTTQFTGTPDEALMWFGRLGCGVAVFGPGAERCWEGLISEVVVTAGAESHSRGIDGMGNRWEVRYTTSLGVSLSTGASSNTSSAGVYGTRDQITSISGSTSTGAQQLRAQLLAARAWPQRRPSSEVATGADAGQMTIGIHCVGWYDTLGWVNTSRTDTTTEETTVQVGDLIGTSSPGIGATNAFLSTTEARITASGISDTRFIDEDTPYRAKIEALLSQGNSSGQRFAWGVYEGRQFVNEVWAGATPSTLHYVRWLGGGVITNPQGGIVDPWNIRPNRMYQVAEFAYSATRSTEQDGTGRYYVARVRFAVDASGVRVGLEPGEVDDLSARLARIGRAAR